MMSASRERSPAQRALIGYHAPRGFSLLEVILATAILAASSMVLVSLIGLGTKYGNRAEEQTLLASQAQSLLDEFIVSSSSSPLAGQANESTERSGLLPGRPSHTYRLRALPFDAATTTVTGVGLESNLNPSSTLADDGQSNASSPGLTLVSVQVFASSTPTAEAVPLLELSQLVRSSLLTAPATAASDPFRMLE